MLFLKVYKMPMLKSNASGDDGWNFHIIRPFCLSAITHVISFSLEYGIIANISSLLKIEKPEGLVGYRAISILPILSKIFKLIAYEQILVHISKHNLIAVNQSDSEARIVLYKYLQAIDNL